MQLTDKYSSLVDANSLTHTSIQFLFFSFVQTREVQNGETAVVGLERSACSHVPRRSESVWVEIITVFM